MRVFISSTCYDLLDLRAELEVYLRQAGVEPVMSDSLTSDFQVSPDRNSIETCLANVRNCDQFIIILSNRYGPSLASAGFPDASATHLEYLEAKKANIPIHMYVRDRLEADFAIWKANPDKEKLTLSWCKSEKEWRIFELIKEHRALQDTGGNNWFWIFRNSLELKDRISLDFKDAFASAIVRGMFNSGNFPLIEIETRFDFINMDKIIHFTVHLRNVGQAPAISPEFHVVGAVNRWPLKTLQFMEETQFAVDWLSPTGTKTDLETRLKYSTLQGHMFVDKACLSMWYIPEIHGVSCGVTYTLKDKHYLGVSDAALLKMPNFA